MTGPRDWDKELADIDRLMGLPQGASGPPAPTAPSAPPAPPKPGAPPVPPPRPVPSAPTPGLISRPRDTMAVWLKAGLGAFGAAALAIWPYEKDCGLLLWVYLVGVAAVGGAGIWTLTGSWRHRRALAHVAGFLVLLAALVLAAIEILPRVGYLQSTLPWVCSS